ncbi:hypothetical protein FRC09_004866 [Ceratobasidium sp. 395]|nr:hypothetical protein FRC09_004866 [Ceratobasidium sp. 395]
METIHPPAAPHGFPGITPNPYKLPPSLSDLVAANRYSRNLQSHFEILPGNTQVANIVAAAMLYEIRTANLLLRTEYPQDFRDSNRQEWRDEISRTLGDVVAKAIEPRMNELRDDIKKGREALERRIGAMDKRLIGFNKDFTERFEKADKQLQEFNQRYIEADERLNKFDKHFDENNQRLNKVDQQLGGINTRLDEANKRYGELNGQLTTVNGSLKAVQTELTQKLDGLTARIEELEKNTIKIKQDLSIVTGGQDIRNTLDEQLAGLRADSTKAVADLNDLRTRFGEVKDLGELENKVFGMDGRLTDLLNRAITLERSNCLFINGSRLTDGPWVEVPNSAGVYPRKGHGYPLLANNATLAGLGAPVLREYLTFYGLPFPDGATKFNGTWTEKRKEQAVCNLRVYLTTPS